MAEETQGTSNKTPGINIGALLTAVTATILLFAVVGGLSGCLQNIDFGNLVRGGDTPSTLRLCSVAYMTFGLQIAGWFLGLAGTLFDYTLLWSVTYMGALLGKGSPLAHGVAIGWTVIRDLINLVFIGALVYAAIALILRISEGQVGKLIVRIIIAALLINFSFFFAGVIVDASNFISQKIYEEAIYTGERLDIGKLNPGNILSLQFGASGAVAPVSERFMAVTRLSSLYSISGDDFTTGGRFADNQVLPYIIAGVGFFMFALTAGIFTAAAVFLLIRFVLILILLITSPIGMLYFVGIPKLVQWGKAWWDTLIAQALFPIAFLILVGISFKVMEVGFLESVQGGGALSGIIGSPDSLSAWYNTSVNLFVVYGIAWILLFFSLKVATNIAQQKDFTPPTPAKLFEVGVPVRKFVARQLFPRSVAFRAAQQVVREVPETVTGVIPGARRAARDIRTVVGLPGAVVGGTVRAAQRVLGGGPLTVEERRTNRLLDAIENTESDDTEVATKARGNIKSEFETMSRAERAKRWNGMNAKQRAIVEDTLTEEMIEEMRADARGAGSISSKKKTAPGGGRAQPTQSGNAATRADMSSLAEEVQGAGSHKALREDKNFMQAARRSLGQIIDELKKSNTSLARLPVELLVSKDARRHITVQTLVDVGRDTKNFTYEEYERVVRAAPRKVRKRFLSGPGRFGRPVRSVLVEEARQEPDTEESGEEESGEPPLVADPNRRPNY